MLVPDAKNRVRAEQPYPRFSFLSILCPLILVSYFFLHLWAVNLEHKLPLSKLFAPYAAALLLTLLLWILFTLLFKDRLRASFLTSIWVFLFLSYGHILNMLKTELTFPVYHRYTFPFFLFLFILSFAWILKAKQAPASLRYFTLLSVLLVLIPLAQVAIFKVEGREYRPSSVRSISEISFNSPRDKPDIYLIVLDEYARADILRSVLHFDNEPFLDSLRNKGFKVIPKSTSNYFSTIYSLPSILNFRYHNSVLEDFDALTQKNRAASFLKENFNYRYVVIDSGFIVTQGSPLADETISAHAAADDVLLMVINSTLLNAFSGKLLAEDWKRRHLYNFKELEKLPLQEGRPKFVFAHILLPHPPFVFHADEKRWLDSIRFSPKSYSKYKERYPQQLAYTNQLVRKLIEALIHNSSRPPVILLTSDHGIEPSNEDWEWLNHEALHERTANFMAFYLPGMEEVKLSDSMTPVNILRVVFDYYFGTKLGLLEDKIFLETDSDDPEAGLDQEKFMDVTGLVREFEKQQVKAPASEQALSS